MCLILKRSLKLYNLYFVMNSFFLIRTAGIKEKLPVNQSRVGKAEHHHQEAEHLQTKTQSHCWARRLDAVAHTGSFFFLPRGLPTGLLSCWGTGIADTVTVRV